MSPSTGNAAKSLTGGECLRYELEAVLRPLVDGYGPPLVIPLTGSKADVDAYFRLSIDTAVWQLKKPELADQAELELMMLLLRRRAWRRIMAQIKEADQQRAQAAEKVVSSSEIEQPKRLLSDWEALKKAFKGSVRALSLQELRDDYDIANPRLGTLVRRMEKLGWVRRVSTSTWIWKKNDVRTP